MRAAAARCLYLLPAVFLIVAGWRGAVGAAEPAAANRFERGDRMLAEYFRLTTRQLTENSLSDIRTAEDWRQRRDEYRRQLFEMLGLDPLPEKTPLHPQITGRVDHPDFTVEKLHFQSRPGLYVTGNFYLPKKREGKLPTILYVCGHARVVEDGLSMGNKTGYQHHGAWFARNGYACLTIDTLQLGEIEGIHHGTFRYGMWWWNARGYTPAGVEAWNSIRALDYLETRPEVDASRIGVTGRSGGGASSWWIAALDERIKVAVPVAGITNLQNHVVDGVVEGHCDCMYYLNSYRWDFPQLAALVSPRPLLITNTDKDRIFPLDGVVDVYQKTRRIYELQDARARIGLQISEGPHKDIQELQIAAFHWFNRFLKGEDPQIEMAAEKLFQPAELRVFQSLPSDERNTSIHEDFVPAAETPVVPENAEHFAKRRDEVLNRLLEKSFGGWPRNGSAGSSAGHDLQVEQAFSATQGNVQFSAYDFTSQEPFRLRLYVAHRAGLKPADLKLVVLNALDEAGWRNFLATMRVGFEQQLEGEELPEAAPEDFKQLQGMFDNFQWAMAYVAPRGIGRTAWSGDEKKQVQIRRRFMLLGETLDGMRVWDVRRGVQALRSLEGMRAVPLWMQGERKMAGITLYASLFEPDVARLDLWRLAPSHSSGPVFLNVLRTTDIPEAVALAAEKSQVRIYEEPRAEAGDGPTPWEYPQQVAKALNWPEKQLQIRPIKVEGAAQSGE